MEKRQEGLAWWKRKRRRKQQAERRKKLAWWRRVELMGRRGEGLA
jgi:hypothetical protein